MAKATDHSKVLSGYFTSPPETCHQRKVKQSKESLPLVFIQLNFSVDDQIYALIDTSSITSITSWRQPTDVTQQNGRCQETNSYF